jgi:long-chain acyl-CoA synthetase
MTPQKKQSALLAAAKTLPNAPDAITFRDFATLPVMLASRTAEHPEQEALVFIDENSERLAWTYEELTARVDAVAGFLQGHGIGHGDRIATVAHNHADTVVQYLAAWSLGAVVVPVNVGEDNDRIIYILSNSLVRLAFVRHEYLERLLDLKDNLPALETVVVCGGDGNSLPTFADALAHDHPTKAQQPDPDDEALIVYTSGTTGHPKGVVLTQSNLLVDAAQIARWHGLKSDDRMMCVLPIHHVNGTIVTLVTPLAYGGTAVLCRKFQTSRFFPLLAAENIAVVSVVPTLLSFLLQGDVSVGEYDLSKFRHIICGAGPLTVELALQFQDRFNLRILHGYGLSETTCYSCFLPVDLDADTHRSWLGDHGFPSIGCAIPVNEMAIHDGEGQPVASGERGEIVIRGHNVMAGYFQNDTANADAFTHAWFRSGDEGFWLAGDDGREYFFITGRLKELIIRGGVNVSPLEIDEVLMNLPGVKAGVSVGFENNMYGEEIGAYVVMEEGEPEDPGRILSACLEELPHHKCPKVVVFGTDVPVTSTGKYQRNRLKPLFAEWRAEQFRKPSTS